MPRTHQKTPFHCPNCPRTFKTRNGLNIHYGLQHRATIHVFSHAKVFDKVSSVSRHISRKQTCKDNQEKAKALNSGGGGGTDLENNLEFVGEYTLIKTQDIEMQDADIPGMGPPDDFPPQVANPNASDEPQAHPERGTPGPEGSNYCILDPENDGEPSVPGSPPLSYDPKEQVWIEKYPVPTAGMPIRKATREEITKYLIGEPGNIGELSDPDNFEIPEFLFQSGLSVQEGERFLNLKKAPARMYPATLSFLHLLNALVPFPPDNLGSGHRIVGTGPYVKFVLDDVLLKVDTREYADPGESRKAMDAALEFVQASLEGFDLSAMCIDKLGTDVLLRVLVDSGIKDVLLGIVAQAEANQDSFYVSSLVRTLRILARTLEIKDLFIEVTVP
ncbi:hypothetical protein FRC11_009280 [Ceratobasidium sp. 423]|nr:hypothetical protein FRC11_009280 [Ceratobasidium sp. 423]